MTEDEQAGEPRAGADRIVRNLHDEIGLFVSAAWDGHLTPEENEALAKHLRECKECWDWSKRFLAFLARLEPTLRKVCREDFAEEPPAE